MTFEMMREIFVVLNLWSRDDDEAGGNLVDDKPVENHQITYRDEYRHYQEMY